MLVKLGTKWKVKHVRAKMQIFHIRKFILTLLSSLYMIKTLHNKIHSRHLFEQKVEHLKLITSY